MKQSLKERLERLDRIPGHARATCGSAVALVLSLPCPPGGGLPETISATRALVRAGMDVLKAKRAIEGVFNDRETVVDLPMVENTEALIEELARSGIYVKPLAADPVAATVSTP